MYMCINWSELQASKSGNEASSNYVDAIRVWWMQSESGGCYQSLVDAIRVWWMLSESGGCYQSLVDAIRGC